MESWTLVRKNTYQYNFDAYTAIAFWGEFGQCWYFGIYIGDKFLGGRGEFFDCTSAMIMAAETLWDEFQSNKMIHAELGA